MIDAVLFDFGGVFTASPFHLAGESGGELGHDPEVVIELVFGPYGEDTDHPWHRLERGEMTFMECREAIMTNAAGMGIEMDPFDVFRRKGDDFHPEPRTELIERTKRLRDEGYRTALVTNNIKEFGDAWRKMIPVEEMFDVVVDSSHEGVRKPNPAIFHLALERLGGIPAGRAVFLDDYPGNITAAEALGMRGILVTPAWREAISTLDAVLGA